MITYKRNINLKLLFKSKGLNNIETHLPDGAKYLYSAAVRLGLLDVIDSLKFGKMNLYYCRRCVRKELFYHFNEKKSDVNFII